MTAPQKQKRPRNWSSLAAKHRRRTRYGRLLRNSGLAVLAAAALGVVVPAPVLGDSLNWVALAAVVAGGGALWGVGQYVLSRLLTTIGLGIIAETGGDKPRYDEVQNSFKAYCDANVIDNDSVRRVVDVAAELEPLRDNIQVYVRQLRRANPGSERVVAFFHGQHHIGFHVGLWLRAEGLLFDLYGIDHTRKDKPSPLRVLESKATYFAATRLLPSMIDTPPAVLSHRSYSRDANAWAETPRVSGAACLDGTLTQLGGHSRGCMALAVNVVSPIDDQSFIGSVCASAEEEGASHLIFLGRQPPAGSLGPPEPLRSTQEDYEATVAAIVGVANQMNANPGLLYLKTPACIPPALGHYLRAKPWIPMRHIKETGTYERFAPPPAAAAGN